MFCLYLKALEIQGFKSFPDKTVLSFDEAITAIVGPNGSGKSNISDAVRWVMGEQSTRALRGGKMEDVIFGGTLKRKPLGYAEVSLILDNADSALHMEENEVMVTRRFYRSGESEYYINRRTCRLKDINELFMDTGLGKEGYSIIGQGRIDEILSTKGSERRTVFEEAAGISRYRHRKEEAERKLSHTADNLLRIGDKISELELQIAPLEKQAEKARKYLDLREQLKGLEISLWLENLEELRVRSRKLATDYENAAAQRQDAAEAQERFYQRLEELNERKRRNELEMEELTQRISQLENEENMANGSLAVLKTQMTSNAEQTARLSRELEQQEGREDTIAGQIQEREQRLNEIRQRLAEMERQLEEKRQASVRNQENASRLAEQIYRLQEQEAIQTTNAAEERSHLSALAAMEQHLLDRDTILKGQIQGNQDRLKELETEAARQRSHLEEVQERRGSIDNVIAGYQLRMKGRDKRFRDAEQRSNAMQLELGGLQNRIRILSDMEKMYEGYNKAVKVVMNAAQRGQLRGIHGPVASLMRVGEEVTLAIETALGAAMQNIVVEREEEGKAAINFLKRRDGGRATFLPLTAVRPNQLREQNVERCRGFVGIGNMLVGYDQRYQNIFANLLGRVVIVQDMDCAIAMARQYGYRFKIVTLDGQVLNPGGSMTGGSSSRTAGILSRAGELERLRAQEAELQRQFEEARSKLETFRRDAQSAAYDLENAQEEKRTLESQFLKAQGEVNQSAALLELLHGSQQQWEEELAENARKAAEAEAETAAAQQRIAELERRAQEIRAESDALLTGQQTFRDKGEALGRAITDLNVEKAALEAEENATAGTLSELRSMARDITGDRESRQRQIAECESREASLLEQISHRESMLTALRERRNHAGEQRKGLAQRRLELEGQRESADQSAREQNDILIRMERECSVLEQRKAAAAMEERQLLDKLWENYELTYDSALPQRQPMESAAKAGRQIADLKRSITMLGTVNVGAIEEFRRVKERYDYLNEQRSDVLKAKTELEKIIADITGEMKKIFREQFDLIGGAFGQTFQELFGGGKATLELENPEDILNCGIEIRVQPPGKTLKVLTLLSGGEKAFVAIALYFAFLKVRPAPFVVMDEIEAALDDTNVIRFASYMRSMCASTQFVVITHRRGTMEEADVLYGVTMQEKGVSRMLTINLNEAEKVLGI